jgi:hypothetical protein
MAQNITFRTQLVGGVTDFCQAAKLSFMQNIFNFVELIVLLARYREERVVLCPKVYISNNLQAVISMLPGGDFLKIGTCPADLDGIRTILKRCAPLALGEWAIYIEDRGQILEYGLFRGAANPISVLMDDVLMSPNEDMAIVKAHQIASDCVEVRSNNQGLHYIFLDHRKEDSPAPLLYLGKLVNSLTMNVTDVSKDSVRTFLHRLLFDSLRESHGCIIVVTNMIRIPKFLSNDGVTLESPIDFSDLVKKLKKNEVDSSYLLSKSDLLRGMLNSDGAIVFNTHGRLLGYNCFVGTNRQKNLVGGARKRAFESLTTKIGSGINAVFMQSQDGWTEYKGIGDE